MLLVAELPCDFLCDSKNRLRLRRRGGLRFGREGKSLINLGVVLDENRTIKERKDRENRIVSAASAHVAGLRVTPHVL